MIAFGWVNVPLRARWLVVEQPAVREIYAAAAHMPVRISTVAALDVGRATFRYSMYDADGVFLGRRRLVAQVAG